MARNIITEVEFIEMHNEALKATSSHLDTLVEELENDMEIQAIMDDPTSADNKALRKMILWNAKNQ